MRYPSSQSLTPGIFYACCCFWSSCFLFPLVCQAQTMLPVIERWSGQYPVNELYRMPEEQMINGTGFVNNAATWNKIWHGANQSDAPAVDFHSEIVCFAHNVVFLNILHVTAGTVDDDGVVDVLAIQTKTARPIDDFVYWSAGTIPIAGLTHLRVAGDTLDLTAIPEPGTSLIVVTGLVMMVGFRYLRPPS